MRTALRRRAERARGLRGQLALRSGTPAWRPARTSVRSGRSITGTVARAGRGSAAAFAEEALHDAVLETVEGDDGEPAAGLERALGGLEPLLELVELGVQDGCGSPGRCGSPDRSSGRDGSPRRGGRSRPARRCARPAARRRWRGRSPGRAAPPHTRAGPGRSRPRRPNSEIPRRSGPTCSIRMSSGPSAWNEKPRSAWSICIELTPISSAIAVDEADAAFGERPVHLAEALFDQGQAVVRDERRPASIASGSRSKPITSPAPAASKARV